VNSDANRSIAVGCRLIGFTGKTASGRILTAPTFNSVNTFAHPDVVVPAAFNDLSVNGDTLSITLPAKSIVVVEL
jgi:alpha-N-arabinofuranosidase